MGFKDLEDETQTMIVVASFLVILIIIFFIISSLVNQEYENCTIDSKVKEMFFFNNTCYQQGLSLDHNVRFNCEKYDSDSHKEYCEMLYGGRWE
jgi:hypothetical protein